MKTKSIKFVDRLCLNFLVLCLALYSPANFAAEQEIAGRVVAVNGQVDAIDSTGNSRALSRRDTFYAGEIIVTQPASFAQIRMTDSAIVSLKESTQFEILAYSYENPGQEDISTMRLIEGGFRTITGQIGGQGSDAYSIETEYATIGIRGTDHEGVLVSGILFTGVYDGGTSLENDAGVLNLGIGANFDFAQASDANSLPLGLTLPPPALGNIPVLNVPAPQGGGGGADGDGNDDGGDGNNGGGGNGGNGGAATGTGGTGGATAARSRAQPAPQLSLDEIFDSVGADASGGVSSQQTNEIRTNPNETTGDGALDCALNTNNPVCRPTRDPAPTTPGPDPDPDPDPTPPAPAPAPPAPAPAPPAPAPAPPAPAPAPPAPAPAPPAPAPAPAPPAPAPAPPAPAPAVDPGPVADRFGLNSSEIASLNKIGLAAAGNREYVGGVSNGADATRPFLLSTNKTAPTSIALGSQAEVLSFASLVPATLETSVGGFNLSWGLWNATDDDRALLQKFANSSANPTTTNLGAGDTVANPRSIILTTGVPTNVASLTGQGQKQFTADQSSDHLFALRGFGSGSTDAIDSFTASFYVDLGNAYISDAQIDICITDACSAGNFGTAGDFGVDYWPVQGGAGTLILPGYQNLVFAQSDFSIAAGKDNFLITTADAGGFFVGTSSLGFVLTFESSGYFWDEVDLDARHTQIVNDTGIAPLRSIGGTILFSDHVATNYVISSAERSTIDRYGFAISSDSAVTSNQFIFGGTTANLNGADASIITSTTSTKGDGISRSAFSVLRQGTAPIIGFNDGSGLPFTWGFWQSDTTNFPARFYPNAYEDNDLSDHQKLADTNIVVANFLPTAKASLRGSRIFETKEFIANVIAGSTVTGSFDFDFENAQIDDFKLQVCVGPTGCSAPSENWLLDPLDPIDVTSNGLFFAKTVTGQLVTTSNAFNGELNGGFISGDHNDPNIDFVEGLVAGFRFKEVGEVAASLNGAALFLTSDTLGVAESAAATNIGFGIFPGNPSGRINSIRGIYGSAAYTDSQTPRIIENLRVGSPLTPNTVVDTSISGDQYYLLRGRNAELTEFPDVDGNNGLNWGLWLSASEGSHDPFILHGGGGILEATETLSSNNAWFSVGGETNSSYFNVITGHKRFEANHSDNRFEMQSNNSNWTQFEFTADFEIDLTNATLTGDLDISVYCTVDCSTETFMQKWDASIATVSFASIAARGFRASLTGMVDQNPTGSPANEAFDGTLQGYFVGTGGSAISAGFSLGGKGSTNTTDFVSGLIVFDALEKLSEASLDTVINNDSFGFAISDSSFFTTKFDSDLTWGWSSADGEDTSALFVTRDDSPLSTLTSGAAKFDIVANPSLNGYTAAIEYLGSNSANSSFESGVGGFELAWGLWNNSGDQIKVFDEASLLNGQSGVNLGGLHLLVSATPAYVSGEPVLTGSAFFNVVSNFVGGRDDDGPTDAIDLVTGSINLDLGSGILTLNSLEVCSGGSIGSTCAGADANWVVNTEDGGSPGLEYASAAGKGLLGPSSVSGSIVNSGTDGSFDGLINGFVTEKENGKKGFVLGFNFENMGPGDFGTLIGAALFTETPVPLSNSYAEADFNSVGFSLFYDTNNVTKAVYGTTIFKETYQRQDLISFAGDGSITNFLNNDPDELIRPNTTLPITTLSSGIPQHPAGATEYDVHWAVYDSDSSNRHQRLTDFTDDSEFEAFTHELVSVAVQPLDISQLTGSARTFIGGSGSILDGSIIGASTGSFDIDLPSFKGYFDTTIDMTNGGALSSGYLEFAFEDDSDNLQEWKIHFTGNATVFNPSTPGQNYTYLNTFSIDSNKSSISYLGDTGIPTGQLVGIFASESGETGNHGFAGGFSLRDTIDPAVNARGAFLLQENNFLSAEKIQSFTSQGMFVSGSALGGVNNELARHYGSTAIPSNTGKPIFVARIFNAGTIDEDYNVAVESIVEANTAVATNLETVNLPGSNTSVQWGKWQGTTSNVSVKNAAGIESSLDQNAYWFLAEPSKAVLPISGEYRYSSIVDYQGESNYLAALAYKEGDITLETLTFDLDFGTGVIDSGHIVATATVDAPLFSALPIKWDALFSGTATGATIKTTVTSGQLFNNTVPASPVDLLGAVDGTIEGYFVGESAIDGVVLGINLSNGTAPAGPHALAATAVLEGIGILQGGGTLSIPDPTLETHDIDWGTWNNPIEDNWVVTRPGDDGRTELETGNHLAMIDATPVANLTGSGSYGSTLASSFIGSGSAGDITQLVAGLDVDFNTGVISNGSLQIEVAGSQAWDIDFAGSINNGMVDLNSIGGTLSDPGGLLSNSIEANLGGVFTGVGADAFVGGFDLIDQLDQFNQVEGLYTIER